MGLVLSLIIVLLKKRIIRRLSFRFHLHKEQGP